MPLVRCNAMALTDETEEEGALLKVLVTRSDPVADTTVVTEEEAIPPAPLTGTAAERHYMERKICHKWCERLWQAMLRVQMRKNRLTIRAVERASARRTSTRRRRCSPRRAIGGRTSSTLRAQNQ
jgi:hypothetical protein